MKTQNELVKVKSAETQSYDQFSRKHQQKMEIPYQERSFSSFFAFGYRVHTKWRNKFKLERVRWKINNEEFYFKKLGNEFVEEISRGM
jgi:hypothetical protein